LSSIYNTYISPKGFSWKLFASSTKLVAIQEALCWSFHGPQNSSSM
jgi:hypothetical protein